MKNIRFNYCKTCIICILIALLVILNFSVSAAIDKTPKVLDDKYIYLDLYYGTITINGTNYSGYVIENGEPVLKSGSINGKGIYIYQSNGDSTVWENGLPKYDRIAASNGITWGEYITNNTNVNEVITSWNTQAKNCSRNSTSNYINIKGSGSREVVLDNIWSSYQVNSQTRTTGGLSFYPNSSSAGTLTVDFKGDNRFGNIFYATDSSTKHKMIFSGDNDATLTVANFTANGGMNHYNSAIGGSDSAASNTIGLIFESGIVYAGTTSADNCTSIGAGGNAKGGVTINGGTITAVSNSTGTAIGGGIGFSSVGGDAEVTITGGTVYAYNFGYGGIPVAAIGGGSSSASSGNASTTVTITGGKTYAKSVGGTAIGGGSSKTKNGGPATVIIGGTAEITALSVASTYNGSVINAGAAIGGGTGGTDTGANGGDANLKVSGNAKVYTGSIGGGKTNNSTGHIGKADIEITENPQIQGQFVMAAGTSTPCSFIMSGGTIDNGSKTSEYVFLQENGGAVYIENGNATMSGGTIKNCLTAQKGGAVYVAEGDFIMTSGTISNCTATDQGGAIYVNGGNIVIGVQSCGGKDTSHSHPIISNNTATNNGGAVAVNGGQITMYCGILSDNISIKNQESNSVYQSGGRFDVNGGSLGTGILIVGGVYNDERDEIYQVRYHANYDGVNVSVLRFLENEKELILPKEKDFSNEAFKREGLYLIGWSTTPDSTEGYMLVGNKIVISNDTELYAVWGTEEPIASYTVFIPDVIDIDETTLAGQVDIGASFKYVTNISTLSVKLQNKGDLAIEDKSLEYRLLNMVDNSILSSGSTIKNFTTTDINATSIKAEVLEKPKYAGIYNAILTFSIEFDEGL